MRSDYVLKSPGSQVLQYRQPGETLESRVHRHIPGVSVNRREIPLASGRSPYAASLEVYGEQLE